MGSDQELDEKNFIQEHGSKFVWIFLFLFLFIIALLWGVDVWQKALEKDRLKNSPFYQVTNREFSIFLWQNPQFMRGNANLPEAYLPHFRSRGGIHVIPELADDYVVAPPEILYRYHVWKRLIGDSLSPRPIFQGAFMKFLHENPEWLPKNWKEAPPGYITLVNSLNQMEIVNLQPLSEKELPFETRMAYQGWFNYTREWEKISLFFPSEAQLEVFLQSHPHYTRSYWRNMIPDYLLNLEEVKPLEESDFSSFLKIALFNSLQPQSTTDQ